MNVKMTDNRTTELLPCPICGGQPDFQHFNITPNVQGRIICSCGLSLVQGKNDTEDDMRIIWNTRSDYAVQAENERKAEQAIAATLGRPKAKAHPYGYEPDTGAFDCTRCECGCINDISATYCNDCGGEIEIDMYAEKEIYHIPCHLVFAEKHDDGSLEFGGKRYVAATLGSDASAVRLAERLRSIADEMSSVGASSMTPHELLACYANDVEKVADSLMFAATLGNSRAERTCKQEERGWGTEGDHARVWLTCGHDCMVPTVQDLPNYCPKCGCKVVGE